MTFFLYQNEQTLGPYTREETLIYIREGFIAAQDFLYPEGAQSWVSAQDTFPHLYTSGFKLRKHNAKEESGPIELKVAASALISPTSLDALNSTMRIALPPKRNGDKTAASVRSEELKKQTRKATQSISGINMAANGRRATADLSALLQEKKGFLSRLFRR